MKVNTRDTDSRLYAQKTKSICLIAHVTGFIFIVTVFCVKKHSISVDLHISVRSVKLVLELYKLLKVIFCCYVGIFLYFDKIQCHFLSRYPYTFAHIDMCRYNGFYI